LVRIESERYRNVTGKIEHEIRYYIASPVRLLPRRPYWAQPFRGI